MTSPLASSEHKVCCRCGVSKLTSEFSPHAGRSFGVAGECKACRRELNDEYRARPESKALAAERHRRRKERLGAAVFRANRIHSTYGVSPEAYERMLEAQLSRCAICHVPFGELDICDVVVDHDHSCCAGKRSCGQCVRGLLCRECNFGIGKLKDSPATLRAAADYLERTHEDV